MTKPDIRRHVLRKVQYHQGIPFLITDFARLFTLIAFPAMSLFLPQLLR